MANKDRPSQARKRSSVASRRLTRWLTFSGAFVVFVTFVVKEGFRDHLKDLKDSIDAAQGIFLIRTENIKISGRLEEIRQEIKSLRLSNDAGAKEYSLFHAAMGQDDLVMGYVSTIRSDLDNISRLITKLPNQSTPISFKYWGLPSPQSRTPQGHLQALQDQVSQLLQSASKVRQLIRPDQMDDDVLGAAQKLFGDSVHLAFTARDFGRLILDEALKVKVKSEYFYEVLTRLSYVLYVLGWGLSLFGGYSALR